MNGHISAPAIRQSPQAVRSGGIFAEMQHAGAGNPEIIGYICNGFTPSVPKPAHNEQSTMTQKLLLTASLLFAAASALAQPKIIAHRGYWTVPGSAQNSLASFTKADSCGVFGSEIDVWLTADDRLIVNHDRIYRGTDIDMERSKAREIQLIVLPNGENIPSLDEYLELVASKPATRLVLEMKSLSDLNREDLAARKIVQALKKHELMERTDLIAFSINACLAFRKIAPDARVFYLNGDLPPQSIRDLGLTGIDYSGEVLRQNPEWVKQAHDLGLEETYGQSTKARICATSSTWESITSPQTIPSCCNSSSRADGACMTRSAKQGRDHRSRRKVPSSCYPAAPKASSHLRHRRIRPYPKSEDPVVNPPETEKLASNSLYCDQKRIQRSDR